MKQCAVDSRVELKIKETEIGRRGGGGFDVFAFIERERVSVEIYQVVWRSLNGRPVV